MATCLAAIEQFLRLALRSHRRLQYWAGSPLEQQQKQQQ